MSAGWERGRVLINLDKQTYMQKIYAGNICRKYIQKRCCEKRKFIHSTFYNTYITE